MKPMLQILDSNESILLMYLADELPAEERAEVDALLQADGGLRTQLSEMRAAHAALFESMRSADLRSLPILRSAAINRQTNRLLLDYVNRPVQPTAVGKVHRGRQVLIASGIAAALLIGSISSYWALKGPTVIRFGPANPAIADNDSADSPTGPANSPTAVADAVVSSDLLERSLEPGQEAFDDSAKHVDLSAAESEIRVVAELSDPHSIDQDVSFH